MLKNQNMLDPKKAAGIGVRSLKPKQAPRKYGARSRSVSWLNLRKLRVEGDKTRYANSRLFLLENGTYVLKYEEALGKPNSNGGMAGIIDFEQELRGT